MGTFVARRALVVGATGLVGRALVAQLLDDMRYASVHVLVRRPWPQGHPRLVVVQTDFDHLPEVLPTVDDVYCCLGTTIAQAGSQAAFRAVDHDLVVRVAQAARRGGAERLAVVSALGASARSRVFYNRVKGEMEAAVTRLGYACVVIARPSLIAGDRASLGQSTRRSEGLALRLLRPVAAALPARWRPIDADVVARALREACLAGRAGVHVIASAGLQAIGTAAAPTRIY